MLALHVSLPSDCNGTNVSLYSAMGGFDGKLKCRKGKYTKENKQKRQPQLNPNAARGSQVSTEGPAGETESRRDWYHPR